MVAWEALEVAASARGDVCDLQEVQMSVSEYKSFDKRAGALVLVCLEGWKEARMSFPSCH